MKSLGTLSIIIPAYNEEERLGATLSTVLAWTRENLDRTEILVVDDGSSDGTAEVARSFSNDVLLVENGTNRGKGFSVKNGVANASGDTILFSDADLSTPIEETARLAAALEHADIAIGSRGLAESNIVHHQPFYREAMGRTFNRIVRGLAVPGVMDTQCGFKMFRGEVARDLFSALTIEGFAFDVELLFLALRRGYRISEVPVTWLNDDRSRVHAAFDSMRMFRDVIRIRARHSRLFSGSSK